MTTLLIDDLRFFRDSRQTLVARTSAEGLTALQDLHGHRIEALWLDHDLGELADGRVDSVMVCVDKLAEYAFLGEPLDVQVIYVHTSNPVGRDQILQTLQRWGYVAKAMQADDYFLAHEPGLVPIAGPGEDRVGTGEWSCVQCDGLS